MKTRSAVDSRSRMDGAMAVYRICIIVYFARSAHTEISVVVKVDGAVSYGRVTLSNATCIFCVLLRRVTMWRLSRAIAYTVTFPASHCTNPVAKVLSHDNWDTITAIALRGVTVKLLVIALATSVDSSSRSNCIPISRNIANFIVETKNANTQRRSQRTRLRDCCSPLEAV